METKTTKLPLIKEIASAMWAWKCSQNQAWRKRIEANPEEILKDYSVTVEQVRTVQNTPDLLHICVPDYQTMRDYDAMNDEEMGQVSGGVGLRHSIVDQLADMDRFDQALDLWSMERPSVSREAAMEFNSNRMDIRNRRMGLLAVQSLGIG